MSAQELTHMWTSDALTNFPRFQDAFKKKPGVIYF